MGKICKFDGFKRIIMITWELVKQAFKSKQVPLILIISGLLLVFLSFFEFEDFKQRDSLELNNWVSLGIGIALILWGAIWHKSTIDGNNFKANNYRFKKVSDSKYSICINQGGEHCINIIYGNINNTGDYDKNTLVILPVNDKFDDQCIDDTTSVLGAFMSTLYPNGNEKFKTFVKSELEKRDVHQFEVGDWIYKNGVNCNATTFNIGIVVVTHLNDDGSIITHTENILLAFKGINKLMAQKRLAKVFIPLIGSGHGGLSPEVSLLCLLLSILDGLRSEVGRRLRDINIVIYVNQKGAKSISANNMKSIVKFVLTYFK